jgi:hypothetical protein
MNAFLLGAGCTYRTLRCRPGYPPLARDFGYHLLQMNFWSSGRLPGTLAAICQILGGGAFGHASITMPNSVRLMGPSPKCDLQQVVPELKRAIVFRYGSRCEDAAKAIGRSTHCTLVHFLRDRVKPGDAIISFNYDTVVERLAKRLGLKLTHCLGRPPRGKVRFAKPHGSVSWQIGDLPVSVPRPPMLRSLSATNIETGNARTEPLVPGAVPIKSELIWVLVERWRFPCSSLPL